MQHTARSAQRSHLGQATVPQCIPQQWQLAVHLRLSGLAAYPQVRRHSAVQRRRAARRDGLHDRRRALLLCADRQRGGDRERPRPD